MPPDFRENIYLRIGNALASDPEIRSVRVFGSFLDGDDPQDVDLAVKTSSTSPWLEQALALKKRLRFLRLPLPVDILPMQEFPEDPHPLAKAIRNGKVLFER